MKVIYVGKEGSGKTLMLGREAKRIVNRNATLYRKTNRRRPIVTNIAFSDDFYRFAEEKGVEIKAWSDIGDLPFLRECDLFIDEIGAYFDARTFADLPLNVRLWLAQAQKTGVHIYGACQDWAQVDVAFRRLVNQVYKVVRVVGTRRPSYTMPSTASVPWVVFLSIDCFPQSESELKYKQLALPLSILFFNLGTRFDFDRFDTNARVLDSKAPPYQHLHRFCSLPGCTHNRIIHR